MHKGVERESPIEKYCVAYAKRLGVEAVKMNLRGARGFPDRMFLIPGGRPLFIEFKRPNKEPTPLQEYIADQMISKGYNVHRANSRLFGIGWINQALNITGAAHTAAMEAARVSDNKRSAPTTKQRRRIVR